jgi:predicted permease
MFVENLRASLRSLRSAPGFTVTAVVSLAIGIGGSLAMFTLVNSLLLKPLAYPESDKLVMVTMSGTVNLARGRFSALPLMPLQFIRWQKEIRSFESFSLVGQAGTRNLTGSGQPETLGAMPVTAGFFDTLKVRPQRGRWFTEAEAKRGAPNVVIISDSFWRRRFSSDPGTVGKTILLNDAPYEVVGIASADLRLFQGRHVDPLIEMPERTDLFLPIRFSAAEEQGGFSPQYLGFARLRAGVTVEQARAELESTLPTFREFPPIADGKMHAIVKPLLIAFVGDVSKGLWLLMFAVALVLTIACANVANLSLARATKRSRELAIRMALGAGRGALIRHSLLESFLLALGGTAVGSIVAMWITSFAVAWAPSQLPRLDEAGMDKTVFGFSLCICALTTLVFGFLPAWRASRADPQQALSASGRGYTDTRSGGKLRAALVSAEVALGTVLVIGSGLLLISFHRVMNAPRGFDDSDILISDLVLPSPRYQGFAKQAPFFGAVRDVIVSIPGVINVAVNSRPPLMQERLDTALREGVGNIPPWELPFVAWQSSSAEYFTIMKIPLRSGRIFRDAGETERVVVVSESAAGMIWPGENPLGKRLSKLVDRPGTYYRVVGVVGDVRSAGLDLAPTPAIYRSFTQTGGDGPNGMAFSIVIRAAIAPDALASSVRQGVWKVDPEIPVPEMRAMRDTISKSLEPRQFQVSLLSAFGFIAVLLAAVGVYGVVSYSVLQRRKDIGVRITLGADQREVHRLVFRNGMTPVFLGLGAGLLAAAILTRLIASMLFGVNNLDPVTFIGAPFVLMVSAGVPCWLTARRAARIDPVVALRLE